MNGLEKYVNIPEIKADINYWMLRTKKGAFFDEFVKNDYIAIGWNIVLQEHLKDNTKFPDLKEQLKSKYPEKNPTTSLNKCGRFVNELQNEDIIVIVGNYSVAFAKIGEYYEDKNKNFTSTKELEVHTQIEENHHKTSLILCPYIKRRKIKIIDIVDLHSINPYLAKAIFGNHHSLSSLNEYAELILNACYGCYIFKNTLSLTFRITNKDGIDAVSFNRFSTFATEMLYNENAQMNVRTALNSPGDISFQIILDTINAIKDYAIPLLVIHATLFGGTIKTKNSEINTFGVVNCIKKVVDKVQNRDTYKLKRTNRRAEEELNKIKIENQKLEEEIKNKKLNAELSKLKFAEENEQKVLEAIKKLDVRLINNNIVDLHSLMQDYQDILDDNAWLQKSLSSVGKQLPIKQP